jgi:hypothetical protein
MYERIHAKTLFFIPTVDVAIIHPEHSPYKQEIPVRPLFLCTLSGKQTVQIKNDI